MIHSKNCPVPRGGECTCGGATPVNLSHDKLCPAAMGATGLCACGATPPKVTDDNPYLDVERSRSLAKRAEAAALEGSTDLANFLLQLAGEARLLAELQGRWEY